MPENGPLPVAIRSHEQERPDDREHEEEADRHREVEPRRIHGRSLARMVETRWRRGGDPAAFEGPVRLSADRLFAIAYRILRDHHAAEDALQQGLITIWDDLPKLRDPDRFEAWTYRVIVRTAVAPGKARTPGWRHRAAPPRRRGPVTGPRRHPGGRRSRPGRASFRRLTPDQRAILVLQHYVGRSLTKIADVLGVPSTPRSTPRRSARLW
jgi:RNA polymerase sigma-70 factor (ECF subfamily)